MIQFIFNYSMVSEGAAACMPLWPVTLSVKHLSIYCTYQHYMPTRTAVSLLKPPLLRRAAPRWQMRADSCSCALTCRLRVNETWGTSSRPAKKRGPLKCSHNKLCGSRKKWGPLCCLTHWPGFTACMCQEVNNLLTHLSHRLEDRCRRFSVLFYSYFL